MKTFDCVPGLFCNHPVRGQLFFMSYRNSHNLFAFDSILFLSSKRRISTLSVFLSLRVLFSSGNVFLCVLKCIFFGHNVMRVFQILHF